MNLKIAAAVTGAALTAGRIAQQAVAPLPADGSPDARLVPDVADVPDAMPAGTLTETPQAQRLRVRLKAQKTTTPPTEKPFHVTEQDVIREMIWHILR